MKLNQSSLSFSIYVKFAEVFKLRKYYFWLYFKENSCTVQLQIVYVIELLFLTLKHFIILRSYQNHSEFNALKQFDISKEGAAT